MTNNDSSVCGVLVVDKPAGFTSHDVVNKLRRLLGTRQVGHTGTLDPLATGVLPVLCGRAVKASEYLTAHDKTYVASMRLGLVSDTEDISGTVTATNCAVPNENEVVSAVLAMQGKRMQIPPMTSAIKVDGRKLIDYARAGKTVEVPPREIEIYSISAEKTCENEYSLTMRVSKGTYVRTVISDIGKTLGCGAVMTALRRTESGNFTLAKAHTLDEIEQMELSARLALLIPVENAFSDLSAVTLPDFFATLAHNGCEVYQKKIRTDFPEGTRLRLYDEKGFLAIGEVRAYDGGSAIKPIKLFRL